jgi:putative membrane protein
MVQTDLLLACLHHLAFLLLIGCLVAQWTLLRMPPHGELLNRLGRIDAGYGLSALAVLVIGALRVFYGLKGSGFYLHNPWFWTKLGLFVAIGLVSIYPTVVVLRWRRLQRLSPGFVPELGEVVPVRRCVGVELGLLPLLFVAAVLMARYGLF